MGHVVGMDQSGASSVTSQDLFLDMTSRQIFFYSSTPVSRTEKIHLSFFAFFHSTYLFMFSFKFQVHSKIQKFSKRETTMRDYYQKSFAGHFLFAQSHPQPQRKLNK